MSQPKSFTYRFKTLNELNKKETSPRIKQDIGREFEKLIQDILDSEKILLKRGYHTNDNKAEQIDGVIEVYNRIILLEVKWENSKIAASSLFSFIGKIENKFEGTIGLFVSRNKLSENFIKATRKGRRQNVVVIDGNCVDNLIYNELSFERYIIEAIKFLSHQNTPIYPIASFLNKIKYENSSNIEQEILEDAKSFIREFIYKEYSENENLEEIREPFEILPDETKNKVYEIIVSEFQENIWERGQSVVGGNYKFQYNFERRAKFLFTEFPADDMFLNDLTLKIVRDLLPFNLELYANSFLIDLIEPFYESLMTEFKVDFENELVKTIDDNTDYYFENSITNINEKLWDKFSSNTLGKIKLFYLDILFSSRDEKFKQKKFSIDLVKTQKLSLEDIYSYINDELVFRKELKFSQQVDLNKYRILEGKVSISNKELWQSINSIDRKVNKE